MFIYENYPIFTNKGEQQNKLSISFKGTIEKVDYPLGVIAYESNNNLLFTLYYAGELFGDDTVEYLLSIIKVLLEQVTTDPYRIVERFSYLVILFNLHNI